MNRIKLLDCTLRDGGYVNDWNFGEKAILDIVDKLEQSNVDVIELGFLKDEAYNKDRTVYNDVKQISEQINPKKEGVTYAAMVEVVNPLSLDKLMPRSEETVGLIRVIVWKRLMREGFEYCKGIKEKGYKISVQPARVDQYSYDEFIEMIELFNTIDPDIFYIVDSFGTQTTETLMPYMKLLDKYLKPNLAVGYHGHNNMMQVFDVAKAFCEMDINRDLYIDSSVYGMGRGAGNLNSEIIAKYLEEKGNTSYNIKYFLDIFDNYLKEILNKQPWGYSLPYYLTAINNCNPNYASYYDLEMNLPTDQIEDIINMLSEEDKIIFTKEKADSYLRQLKKKTFRLAIIVPTRNRFNENHYYIQRVKEQLLQYNVDLIFYDSSTDDVLEKYIENLNNTNIIYDRYDEKVKDDLTIDYKIYSGAEKYADMYDYIWFCRDRSIPHLENIYLDLEKDFKKGRDFAIIYPHPVPYWEFKKEIYDNSNNLAEDLLGEITSLGSIVYSSKLLKKIVKDYPIDLRTNYGLWAVIPLFHYLAKNKFEARAYRYNILEYMPNYKTSFWLKNDSLTWLFGERWDNIMNSLPCEYDEIKSKLYEYTNWVVPPFGEGLLLNSRSQGALKFGNVWRLRAFLIKNKGISFSKVLLISMMPSWYAKYYMSKPNAVINKALRAVYKIFIKFPLKFIRVFKNDIKVLLEGTNYKKSDGVNYEEYIDCFAKNKNIKSNLLVGDQNLYKDPFITFVIPTYKRKNLLKHSLGSVLDQHPVNFSWDIVVMDNEAYEGNEKSETQKYIESLNSDRVKYYRNDKNLGVDGNINRGVELARGKWVALLHDDDLIISEYLIRMKRKIDYYENIGGKPLGYIAPNYEIFKDKNFKSEAEIERYFAEHNNYYCGQDENMRMVKCSRKTLILSGITGIGAPTCGTLVLKKAYIETGGMNENLSIATDCITSYKVMKNYSLYRNENIVGFYRWGENYSISSMHRIEKDLFNFREYIYGLNLFNKFMGKLLRFEHYISEIDFFMWLSGKTSSYFSDICEYKPVKTRNIIFRAVRKIYNATVKIETKINAINAIKFLKDQL